MGYFSNGAEGNYYEGEWCEKCVHCPQPDSETGCAVWDAHEIYNYKECNNPDSILHILIPRKGVENEKCRMFWPK